MAGAGGVFGDSPEIGTHGGQVGNSDWYAPGDARNLFGNNCKCKSKSKHKGKSKCKCRTCTCSRATILPLTKRTFTK
jgi:hypothetical protein